jgi:hypothetical protein
MTILVGHALLMPWQRKQISIGYYTAQAYSRKRKHEGVVKTIQSTLKY